MAALSAGPAPTLDRTATVGAPYALRRVRRDGGVAEVRRFADPAEAALAAALLLDVGDSSVYVEIVPADELEREMARAE